MMDLTGKIALVTGGARDIGAAISLELARGGADVAVNYFDNKEQAESVAAAIRKLGRRAVPVYADVTKAEEVSALVEQTRRTLGGSISVLVNVVGGLVARRPLLEQDEKFYDAVMNVNFKSTWLVTKAVLPHMPEGAAIVNLASQAARDGGGPGGILYAAAKGAVATLTRGLAKELGPRRIRVNAVNPGMIATTFHDTFTKAEVRQKVASMTPLGREGSAEEVAKLVAFLASDAASFINGACVDINGGVYLG